MLKLMSVVLAILLSTQSAISEEKAKEIRKAVTIEATYQSLDGSTEIIITAWKCDCGIELRVFGWVKTTSNQEKWSKINEKLKDGGRFVKDLENNGFRHGKATRTSYYPLSPIIQIDVSIPLSLVEASNDHSKTLKNLCEASYAYLSWLLGNEFVKKTEERTIGTSDSLKTLFW